MDHVIGCKTAQKAWESLQERFASISVVRINQLKIEFHTAKKGSELVDKFLLRLKVIKDQLVAAGERITENDLMIVVLSGLSPKYEVIKTIILARDTYISLKDFRAQLIGVEGSFETRLNNIAGTMSAMYVCGDLTHGQGSQGSYQTFEQGESSNSQRFNGSSSFNGGFGFAGNGGRSFQQRSNFNNNRRFNGPNNNTRSYSNFGNRSYGFSDSNGSNSSSGSVDNKKGQYGSSSNLPGGMVFDKEVIGMVIQITRLLYLQSVKFVQERVILHQTATIGLIVIKYSRGEFFVKFVARNVIRLYNVIT
ncbi:hypothetical protein ACFX2F_007961 [Malus domestica]